MRMHKKWRAFVFGLLTMALVGCGADAPTADPPVDDPVVTQEQSDAAEQPEADEPVATDESADTEDQAPGETSMPDEAQPGSDEFPFPVPKEWEELEPFAETQVGGDMRMYAIYEYTGDADTASTTYQDLLTSAGYVVSANPLLEVTNDAAFTVDGPVNGEPHTGSVAFDTNAEGVQRAIIDLQQD